MNYSKIVKTGGGCPLGINNDGKIILQKSKNQIFIEENAR